MMQNLNGALRYPAVGSDFVGPRTRDAQHPVFPRGHWQWGRDREPAFVGRDSWGNNLNREMMETLPIWNGAANKVQMG